MATSHHDEPPEHGTAHVTDVHGGHDDHGHGHGDHALLFEVIPEDSGWDKFLGFLVWPIWLGMVFFGWQMAAGHPFEANEAEGAHTKLEAPAPTPAGAPAEGNPTTAAPAAK